MKPKVGSLVSKKTERDGDNKLIRINMCTYFTEAEEREHKFTG